MRRARHTQLDITRLVELDRRLDRAGRSLRILALVLYAIGFVFALATQVGQEGPQLQGVAAFLSVAVPGFVLFALARPLRFAHRWAAVVLLLILGTPLLIFLVSLLTGSTAAPFIYTLF